MPHTFPVLECVGTVTRATSLYHSLYRRSIYPSAVTKGLERYYENHDLHFITCSCYARKPQFGTPERRDLLARVLEQTRRRYRFVVCGYVIMPEHVHLLINEPELGDPSVVMKVIKERFTRLLRRGHRHTAPVWEKRFYDFNVWSPQKRIEKLRYIHRNPVRRGLVEKPEDWIRSSFRSYASGEVGLVRVNYQDWPLAITYPHSFENRE